MRYVYPIILYPNDGNYGVAVPDLPGCDTFGETLADALVVAREAIEMWLWFAESTALEIPQASETLLLNDGEIMTLVLADTDKYRKA